MTETDILSHRVRRDLATVSHIAGDLAQRCITLNDGRAAKLSNDLNIAVCRICGNLETEGVTLPAVSEVPLHLLDTPANRRLLEALREAHAAALEVDRERGYGEEGVISQDIENLLSEVQLEVYGPSGTGE